MPLLVFAFLNFDDREDRSKRNALENFISDTKVLHCQGFVYETVSARIIDVVCDTVFNLFLKALKSSHNTCAQMKKTLFYGLLNQNQFLSREMK